MTRAGYIFSAILHAILAIVIIFGLPSFFQKKLVEDSAVVVEILPVSEFTNIKQRRKDPPKEKPKEVSVTSNPKPALRDPTIKLKPEMSKPEPAPVPKVVEKPRPEPKVAQAELKPLPKPVQPQEKPKKPEPKKKEEKPEDLFGAVLNTVEKIEASQPKEEKKAENEADFSDIEDLLDGKDDQPEFKPGLPMSISEKDAIKRQIMENWTVLSGAKDAKDMVVTLEISLMPDGSVKDIAIRNMIRYNTDSFYKAMVDSAVRAVHKSSPLQNLPSEKYAVKDGWRDMEINFDPSEMMY